MIPAKICGITRLEDAVCAIELGASAIGFIFYEKSSRCISPEDAAHICEQLPVGFPRFGVFVNSNRQKILSTIAIAGLTHIQLSGDESAAFCAQLPLPVIKAVRLEDLAAVDEFPAAAFLIDNRQNGAYGGTGVISDWSFCRVLREKRVTVLAGGIGEHNVREAVAQARPDAVDLCSSVEKSPGMKDHQKLKAFFKVLRTVENNEGRLTNGFLTLP
jgi:phosphoribosylanthranilate isomerase